MKKLLIGEYHMTKGQVTDESCERIYSCIGSVSMCIFFLFGLLFVGVVCYLSYMFMNIPATQNLNRNQEALTVEEVWTVDGQFSIWIDDVSEISGDIVKKEYGEDWETEGKRYFDVSFSFQNIGFPGLKVGDQWESDYLSVEISAHTIAKNGETKGTRLQTFGQEAYHTAWQEEREVPVTIGITASDNHMIVAVEEAESAFYVHACVDAEVPSAEAIWYYAQDFLVYVPD